MELIINIICNSMLRSFVRSWSVQYVVLADLHRATGPEPYF